jgi:WD40 repeat protein
MFTPQLGFVSDGRLFFSVDGVVQIWNLATGVKDLNLPGHGDHMGYVEVSANSTRLFVVSHDMIRKMGRLHVYDLGTNRQLLDLPYGTRTSNVGGKISLEGDKLYIPEGTGYRVLDGSPTIP